MLFRLAIAFILLLAVSGKKHSKHGIETDPMSTNGSQVMLQDLLDPTVILEDDGIDSIPLAYGDLDVQGDFGGYETILNTSPSYYEEASGSISRAHVHSEADFGDSNYQDMPYSGEEYSADEELYVIPSDKQSITLAKDGSITIQDQTEDGSLLPSTSILLYIAACLLVAILILGVLTVVMMFFHVLDGGDPDDDHRPQMILMPTAHGTVQWRHDPLYEMPRGYARSRDDVESKGDAGNVRGDSKFFDTQDLRPKGA